MMGQQSRRCTYNFQQLRADILDGVDEVDVPRAPVQQHGLLNARARVERPGREQELLLLRPVHTCTIDNMRAGSPQTLPPQGSRSLHFVTLRSSLPHMHDHTSSAVYTCCPHLPWCSRPLRMIVGTFAHLCIGCEVPGGASPTPLPSI